MDMNEILEKVGGVSKLAGLLGVAHPTVSEWKRTGIVPASRIVQISSAIDVPLADVIDLASPPRAKAAVAPAEGAA